ncbi:tRNA dihydrouridine(20/20a) synthase DusA [Legionella israelensis]|uniref:tRNA-dihydrouridine synthase n=1 Tax=Legionella israelensis TaxID=454 RepID=A0AAX1EGM0_9GAMM|nr:tRNA dihydrouridine(20/20a) synthase DusA [Legionella israelensis]QBR84202.1 tRNA dihydrouridine(20/20a) synthase DusA [Legionella israelensis]
MKNDALKSTLSIAPMIDWSYSHFRRFMRILAPSSLIYTEMQTTGAIEHNPKRTLYFNPLEQPLALQLGGSDKGQLADCAVKAELQGYCEVNLNLGCPSDKVQAGRFGACLMSEPKLVADCIKAMKKSVNITVSAKTRIGIDHQDSYSFFRYFIEQLIEAGSDKIIVHARKAWLKGLSPKQNRSIPPINYDYVYRIKQEYPHIPIVINGNILNSEDIKAHLNKVDGVMLGRLACQNPFAIARIHDELTEKQKDLRRTDLIRTYFDYIQQEFEQGERLTLLLKPIFNFGHGLASASQWKKLLTDMIQQKQLRAKEAIKLLFKLEEEANTTEISI